MPSTNAPLRRLALVVTLVASAAHAAPPATATATATATARDLYSDGVKQIDLRNYAVAVDDFRHAYELSGAPGLLFNIAQAYRLDGKCDMAIGFYENFLDKNPGASNRADVSDLILQCRRQLDDQAAAAAQKAERDRVEAVRVEQDRLALEHARTERERAMIRRLEAEHDSRASQVQLGLPGSITAGAAPTTGHAPFYRRWWFWTAAAGALAVVAVGVGLAFAYGGPVVAPTGSLETIDGR